MTIVKQLRLLALGVVLASHTAHAIDLSTAWQGAREHDPMLASARAAAESGLSLNDQARALWRPTIAASGSAGSGSTNTLSSGAQFTAPGLGQATGVDFRTSVDHGTATQWSLSAMQPIYNRGRLAESRQLEAGASAAEAALRVAEQDAILRTASRYFEVIVADVSLALAGRQLESVERALKEAKDRFRIGDAPVTDSYEAEARAQAVAAERAALETQREMAATMFRDLTGLDASGLREPADVGPPLFDGTLESWMDKALRGSPAIMQSEAGVRAAQEEAAKHRAVISPQLDLVARTSGQNLSGDGDFGAARIHLNEQFVGLQLTLPLYTGGMRGAKYSQSLKKLAQAEADLAAARQQAGQQTRAAWLGLKASATRLAALEAGQRASVARLNATRLGHKVGDRTTLDLLYAENDAATAELALLRGRIERLMDTLRLAAAAGELDEQVLALINGRLAVAGVY